MFSKNNHALATQAQTKFSSLLLSEQYSL